MTVRAVAALLALLAVPVACGEAEPGTTTVRLHMRLSRFEPAELRVPRGRPVRIELVNDDPIDHEWIVGDAGVHERHEKGTEPRHDERPTEVSVDVGTTRVTTVTFDQAGTLEYACHLPGHYAYGMKGAVTVV